MSEEIQRIIGELTARMANVERRVLRIENAFISIGVAAAFFIVVGVLRSVGML